MPFELNKETLVDPLYTPILNLIARGELNNDIKAVQHHFRIGYNRARRILENIKLNHSLIE
ncbi:MULTISPECIES: hypothetical protein [unclassified Serratia (in: enterobacteria)]|uniref:hypothetical protein n=1 Tax=unclassified Serratia (in: enterobacteria) TaxID=2647522 RepID=UPI0005081FD3|nr:MULTISPECIES: hypothetical protein [unclassified Serratia (in: enterobacteria)]KFK92935.1 hypothetical protein JV45_18575 [Serratia sp. Ag2]KFL00034.1 hypothetical protein IV04_03745 [Serratia sp. Ag1]